MAPVYSSVLWDSGGYRPAGSYESGVVLDGFRWVIRDAAVLHSGATQLTLLGGFTLSTSLGAAFFEAGDVPFISNVAYEWHGHQVLEEGDQLAIFTADDAWSWRVSGYVLTLP